MPCLGRICRPVVGTDTPFPQRLDHASCNRLGMVVPHVVAKILMRQIVSVFSEFLRDRSTPTKEDSIVCSTERHADFGLIRASLKSLSYLKELVRVEPSGHSTLPDQQCERRPWWQSCASGHCRPEILRIFRELIPGVNPVAWFFHAGNNANDLCGTRFIWIPTQISVNLGLGKDHSDVPQKCRHEIDFELTLLE